MDDFLDVMQLFAPAVENCPTNDIALGVAAGAHRVDKRQGRLALGEVVAEILAEFIGRGFVIEGIVDELEGRAEMLSIVDHGLLGRLVLPGQHRGDLCSGLEQLRGLAVNDLLVIVLGRIRVMDVHQLLNFTRGDRVGGVGEYLHHAHVPDVHHHLERAGVEEVAHEHARLVTKDRVGRVLPATPIRGIHDVVVQQRCGVNELDDRCRSHMLLAFVAECVCGEQDDDRPEPLAAALHDVLGYLGHECDVGRQA